MGMPKMDIAAMLGSVLCEQMPTPMSGVWWAGMVVHFINGTFIFPLIYAYLLYSVLPGPLWLKGAEWAAGETRLNARAAQVRHSASQSDPDEQA
jgi:hypothetical protein